MDLSWEQHTYLPLSADAEVGSLARYQQPGGSVVSINVGYAPHAYPEVLSLLAGYRRGITGDPRLALAGSVAVIFDLEDLLAFLGDQASASSHSALRATSSQRSRVAQ